MSTIEIIKSAFGSNTAAITAVAEILNAPAESIRFSDMSNAWCSHVDIYATGSNGSHVSLYEDGGGAKCIIVTTENRQRMTRKARQAKCSDWSKLVSRAKFAKALAA